MTFKEALATKKKIRLTTWPNPSWLYYWDNNTLRHENGAIVNPSELLNAINADNEWEVFEKRLWQLNSGERFRFLSGQGLNSELVYCRVRTTFDQDMYYAVYDDCVYRFNGDLYVELV